MQSLFQRIRENSNDGRKKADLALKELGGLGGADAVLLEDVSGRIDGLLTPQHHRLRVRQFENLQERTARQCQKRPEPTSVPARKCGQ